MILSPLRMLPIIAFACATLLARADQFDVVSAQQTSPGNVSATVTLGGPGRLQRNELSLELDGSGPVPASEIAASSAANSPSWLVLCLDRSGSVGSVAFDDLKSALNAALTAQGSPELGFKIAVIGFGTRTVQALGFSSQTAQVTSAIDRLKIEPGGKTKLHDTIASGLATLRAEGDGRKRLMVASDGKDVGSTLSAKRLVELAQQAPAIPIDALSVGALGPRESDSLSLLAGATGGRFIQVTDPGQLRPAVQALLAGNAPAPLFNVAFSYPASTEDRQAETATLLYAPEGRAPVRRPLGIAVAALAQTKAPVAAPDTKLPSQQSQPADEARGVFATAFKWLRAIPIFYWWIAVAVLALLLLLAWLLRSRKDPEPVLAQRPQSDNATVVARPATLPSPAPPTPPRRSATMVGYAWPAPRPGSPTAILRGVSGASRGQQFAVEKAAYRVGCAPDNDLVLIGDDFASGNHALLRFDANALYVEDLGSTNGSRLNGVAFKSAVRSLAPGDELQFGHTTLVVLSTGGGTAAPARSGLEPRVS
jgi:hypothetical protein